MSTLRRALEVTDRAVQILSSRPAGNRDEELLGRLVTARTVIVKAAVRVNDVDALSILTPAERGSVGQLNPTGALGMKDSKLVKKARKLKLANPAASTADVFGALADDAAAKGDPLGREALGVASTAATIAKMRRKAGLR